MVLISDVETVVPYSYSERTCLRCGARMTQDADRDRRGRARWTCSSCGRHAR